MSSGRLLVMALNLRGPIPNAAAINSHLPDSVLLIRLKSESEKGEDMLDESYERLQAWADGTLPGLYGFDDDIDLKHTPEKPRTVPLLHPMLEVEGVSSSSKEICDEIRGICDSRGDHEVRIDVAAGRKEDAASLVRLPVVDDLEGGCTVWYTDATSGTSVEIGGRRVEDGEPPLDHMARFWLNGSPILGAKSVTEPNSLKGVLLTKVLDAIEETGKIPRKMDKKTRKLKPLGGTLKAGMIGDLKKQGIGLLGWDEDSKNAFKHIYENYDNFRFHLDGSPSGPYIDVPMTIWGRGGYWLEDIAALAIVDGWDCERVYVGVSVGDHDHEGRMGCLKAALRYPYGGKRLSRVWSDCHAEGMLPPEFSGLDFLDSESFDSREYDPPAWYREKYPDSAPGKYEDNKEGIKRLVEWAAQEWRDLPPDLRNYLTPHCRNRDLDVFAETSLHCLFVECKLSLGGGQVTVQNKAQIDSLVASSASRGVNYSILTHAEQNADTRRVRAFDYIVPWSKLRRPDEMLKSVIKKRGKRRRGTWMVRLRALTHELKESLDKGEISHEEAFEDLFESINTTSKQKQQRDDSLKEQQRDGSLKEMVVKSGVFEKAIESGDRAIHVGGAIGRAAGVRSWRSVFGVGRSIKLIDYFNHVESGLVRFRQGEDGDWYASQPDAANEEE